MIRNFGWKTRNIPIASAPLFTHMFASDSAEQAYIMRRVGVRRFSLSLLSAPAVMKWVRNTSFVIFGVSIKTVSVHGP